MNICNLHWQPSAGESWLAGWASGLIRQLQISKRREEVHKLPVSRGVECTERGWERHPLLPHCYTFISILTAARCSHFILIYVLHNIICLPENPVLLSGPPNILENFAQFISHLFCFWLINGRWWKVSVVDPLPAWSPSHTSSLVTPPRPECWENVLAFFVSGCWLLSIFPAY